MQFLLAVTLIPAALAVTAGVWLALTNSNLRYMSRYVDQAWGNLTEAVGAYCDAISRLAEIYADDALAEDARIRSQKVGALTSLAGAHEEVDALGYLADRVLLTGRMEAGDGRGDEYRLLRAHFVRCRDDVAAARTAYNSAAVTFNTMCNEFPTRLWTARRTEFRERELFGVDDNHISYDFSPLLPLGSYPIGVA